MDSCHHVTSIYTNGMFCEKFTQIELQYIPPAREDTSIPSIPSTMSDVVGTPTDELGGLSLYQADTELPDYVSSVGSSVSQTKKTTVEVNAEMASNAIDKLNRLEEEVFIIFTYYDTIDVN